MKNFLSCGGGSITIPRERPFRMSNLPSGVVVREPRESVAKSIRRPSTRTVSGSPVKNAVRWRRPSFMASSGWRRPVTKGRLDASPTRCGNARQRAARRAASARASGVLPAAAAWGRVAERPRAGDAEQREGARTWIRTWLPRARTAAELTKVRGIRTFLEVVACREAVHPTQEFRLGNGGIVDPDASVDEPQPVGQVPHRSARIVDVARPERQEAIEFEFPSAVLDPRPVRQQGL